ncbi:hypothetical protein SAMN05660330_01626 [Desulforhopalus singaporensis]|uniref:Fission protein ELM1 n=1 Tax=Desulforhopalus singaporensis TaxID=91360 RepID=A0A1H0PE93_9BACT|nr:hypothetical protein SAMN05660330_01626 [Desulforhopalus singaporensis]
MHIIAVMDGRPGHEKQTLGIIAGLKARTGVHVSVVRTSRPSPYRRIVNGLTVAVPFLYPQKKELQGADLVLCTGSSTHFIALTLKKKLGIPAFCCMHPGSILRSFFDCCFVPGHDGKKGDNIVTTAGAPNMCYDKGKHMPGQGLVLVGGVSEGEHYWIEEKVVSMVQAVISRDTRTHWVIASSPRTPAHTAESLKMFDQNMANVDFVDFKDTWPGWIETQYDRAETVWVTSDSISMIYEAMTAGCRVNIFPMEWSSKEKKFKRNEEILSQQKRVNVFPEYDRTDTASGGVEKLNEAQRIADYILKRWFPENSK